MLSAETSIVSERKPGTPERRLWVDCFIALSLRETRCAFFASLIEPRTMVVSFSPCRHLRRSLNLQRAALDR